MRNFIYSAILLLLLTSCVETVIVGSVAATHLVIREKTIGSSKTDLALTSKIMKRFSGKSLNQKGSNIDVIVNERRVLLIGTTNKERTAKRAERIAWRVRGVKEVINEIELSDKKSTASMIARKTKDIAITSQIESKILLTKGVSSTDAEIVTVNGSVYLLGLAESNYEIKRLTYLISKVKGVKKVVSHIILVDDPRRRVQS